MTRTRFNIKPRSGALGLWRTASLRRLYSERETNMQNVYCTVEMMYLFIRHTVRRF